MLKGKYLIFKKQENLTKSTKVIFALCLIAIYIKLVSSEL